MSNSALISQATERRNSVGIRFGVVRVVAVALTMLAALDADAVVRFPARIPRVPRAPTRVPHAPVIPPGLIDWERRNGPRWPNQKPNKENKDEWVRGRVLIRTNELDLNMSNLRLDGYTIQITIWKWLRSMYGIWIMQTNQATCWRMSVRHWGKHIERDDIRLIQIGTRRSMACLQVAIRGVVLGRLRQ